MELKAGKSGMTEALRSWDKCCGMHANDNQLEMKCKVARFLLRLVGGLSRCSGFGTHTMCLVRF
jgi:hypothetical protein